MFAEEVEEEAVEELVEAAGEVNKCEIVKMFRGKEEIAFYVEMGRKQLENIVEYINVCYIFKSSCILSKSILVSFSFISVKPSPLNHLLSATFVQTFLSNLSTR